GRGWTAVGAFTSRRGTGEGSLPFSRVLALKHLDTTMLKIHRPGPFLLTFVIVALLACGASASDTAQNLGASDRKDLITAIKRLEKKLGLRRTKNFQKESTETAVAYRCYYTGKLELPDSYEKLQLIQGTKSGCPLDS